MPAELLDGIAVARAIRDEVAVADVLVPEAEHLRRGNGESRDQPLAIAVPSPLPRFLSA